MSVILTVNNKAFVYASPGDEAGWGEGNTDWAEEVTTVLSGISGTGDFTEKTFSITTTATNTELATIIFNPASVTGVSLSFQATRGTSPSTVSEKGLLEMVYNPDGSSGEKWSINISSVGDVTGITFTATDAGQLRYSAETGSTGT